MNKGSKASSCDGMIRAGKGGPGHQRTNKNNDLYLSGVKTLPTALEVVILLEEWAIWAKQGVGLRFGYSKVPKPSHEGAPSSRAPLINDTTAFFIDQCVAQVGHDAAREALVMHYIGRMSDRAIGKELGCHHKTVSALLSMGEGEVQEMLL